LSVNISLTYVFLIFLIYFSENVQKLSKLFLDRPLNALNTSAYWVEYIAKYGNVLQSPAINLYWWQQCLLDVYAFILAVIITVFYVVLFIFRKLKKLLFGLRNTKKDNIAMKSKKNKWSFYTNTIFFCNKFNNLEIIIIFSLIWKKIFLMILKNNILTQVTYNWFYIRL